MLIFLYCDGELQEYSSVDTDHSVDSNAAAEPTERNADSVD